MSKEFEEMKKDLSECHTIDEWAAREYGEAYTDFDATAEKMLDRGWRKQSEGEWIKHPDDFDICATEFVCSVCKESFVSSELTDEEFLGMMKYCPHCGAHMKGEK